MPDNVAACVAGDLGGIEAIAAAATVATFPRSGVTSPFPSGWTRFDRKTT
jgi:hypothetical protein